jgi:hypothetical protein
MQSLAQPSGRQDGSFRWTRSTRRSDRFHHESNEFRVSRAWIRGVRSDTECGTVDHPYGAFRKPTTHDPTGNTTGKEMVLLG